MGIHGLMKVIHEEAPEAVREMEVEGYTGRVVAIDASMALYQFLIAIRSAGENGTAATVLTNADGEQTSHIQGMFNRTIRLLSAGIKPVYVFDGKPPTMKGGELSKRTAKREEAEAKLAEAREAGDVAGIEKAQGALVKVSRKDADDVKVLLRLMGVPVVDAPMEAEAQCAEMVRGGKADAAGTEDMDVLTFAAPVQLRRLTFSGKGKEQQKVVEIKHERVIQGLGLTQTQFIDFCIMCGCDYTSTIKGVGPKTALKLIKQHGNIESVLASFKGDKERAKIPDGWLTPEERAKRKAQRRKDALLSSSKANEDQSTTTTTMNEKPDSESTPVVGEDEDAGVGEKTDASNGGSSSSSSAALEEEVGSEPEFVGARLLFSEHEVTPASDLDLKWSPPDKPGLRTFLIERMGFNVERVDGAIAKLIAAQGASKQQRMESFFKVLPKGPVPEALAKKRAAEKKAKAEAAKKAKKAKRK